MMLNEDIAKQVVEFIYQQTGFPTIACDRNGIIIADSAGARIGMKHEGAKMILTSHRDDYEITPEIAASSGGKMKEGYNFAVKHGEEKIGTFGIAGSLQSVKPVVRIAASLISKMIRDYDIKMELQAHARTLAT
ncbi:MAG: sugar diacid recognition domain-containing protein [Desulfocucumaceae bacterium]